MGLSVLGGPIARIAPFPGVGSWRGKRHRMQSMVRDPSRPDVWRSIVAHVGDTQQLQFAM
jgi:hypothetical protein